MTVLPKRLSLAGILALASLVSACGARRPPPQPPPTVYVAHPLQRTIVDWDDYVGHFEAINSVDIRPRVTGYLQSIAFRDGQIVHKGQVLFVIDPRPYQAALTQARGQEAHAGRDLGQRQGRAGARAEAAGRQRHPRAGVRDPPG